MKLVFLTITLISHVLATPMPIKSNEFELFRPNRAQGLEDMAPIDEGRSSMSCEDSFYQAYGQPLMHYTSKEMVRYPSRDDAHEWYGRLVDKKLFLPHTEGWASSYWTVSWEEIYSKCYHALERLGYNGSLAHDLLYKYGNQCIGSMLQHGISNSTRQS